MIGLKVKHITVDNFKKYGTPVFTPVIKPTAEDITYKFWSDIAHFKITDQTEIGICKVYEQSKPIITAMERHKKTPEILIPIDRPFILPLLANGDSVGQAKIFRVDVGEAVVINAGIWHGASIPFHAEQSAYFVIFRRHTPQDDVEKKEIEPIEILF